MVQDTAFGEIYLNRIEHEQISCEALLFVAGKGVLPRQIIRSSLTPTGVVQSLEKLAQKYQEDTDTGLCLMGDSFRYKLVTKADYASVWLF